MVLTGSIVLLVMGFWPQGTRSRLLFFPAESMSPGQLETPPTLPSARSLKLEWPTAIWLEDSGQIHLSFEPGSGGGPTPAGGSGDTGSSNPSGAPEEGNPISHTLVEAQLDMAGVESDPTGMASAPLPLDQGVSFSWTVRPPVDGSYRGVVWLYLRSVPLTGGAGSRRALAALPIEIQTVSHLGLGGGAVRILGVAGTLVSLILVLSSRRMVPLWIAWRHRGSFSPHDKNNLK